MSKYICAICGYIYNEELGIPDKNIPPNTKWEDLPKDWVCPLCGATKDVFNLEKSVDFKKATAKPAEPNKQIIPKANNDIRELSYNELSAICSNLARGCEKQYLDRESQLYTELSQYFTKKALANKDVNSSNEGDKIQQLIRLVDKDLADFSQCKEVSAEAKDRGALRALTWSEKVSHLLKSLLVKYNNEGEDFIAKTNVFVCDICGFIYVGDTPPEICPVCKVPSFKILKIER